MEPGQFLNVAFSFICIMNHYRFIENWVALFNNKNADALAELYSPEAINPKLRTKPLSEKRISVLCSNVNLLRQKWFV